MAQSISEQARQLHQAVTSLVQRYQFRDRNAICCYGVSVSQCYALEALGEHSTLTMQALAEQLHLAVSTVTRVIDQLVKKQLVERHTTARDRRVCCVSLTVQGTQLLQTIHTDLLAREEAMLQRIPAASRAHVIWAIEALSQAVDCWREKCQADAAIPTQGEDSCQP